MPVKSVMGFGYPTYRLQYFMGRHHEHFLQLALLFVIASASLMAYATFYGL